MSAHLIAEKIKASGISIYDLAPLSDISLWIPDSDLYCLLLKGLCGLSLAGLPLRTRSKVLKSAVCEAIGYSIPRSFKKTQPRFPGQNFDTYTQKSKNLQIWNEEIVPARRYVIIHISENDVIDGVRVILGKDLALLDKTGTLTRKYQARAVPGCENIELVSKNDTSRIVQLIENASQNAVKDKSELYNASPVAIPQASTLLPIGAIFNKLQNIVGISFPEVGITQERTRGSDLHRLVCEKLGYRYQDTGQFPDVYHQLLEIKLQTSPTIDLGLVEPVSEESLGLVLDGTTIRHCDVRYAVFYANSNGKMVTITHFVLTTGAEFFKRFPRFEGRITNQKIQMVLPRNFFSS